MKNTRSKAYVLPMVVLLGTALAYTAYSTLDFASGEMRRNKKARLYLEAQQSAEALIQSAFIDLHSRFSFNNSFPIDTLSPTNQPLSISSEFTTYFGGDDSNVVIPETLKYNSLNQLGTEETELIGGNIPPGEWRTINPNLPGNDFDEMKGSRIFVRGVEILAKVTVKNSAGESSTAYARQLLEVRDAPLFANSIFYNLPMEIAPGKEMNLYGPVHANNSIWVNGNGSGGLNFKDQVTTAGDFYHGRHPDSGKGGNDSLVTVANTNGDSISLKKDDSWPDAYEETMDDGDWLETGVDNFKDLAANIWDGNLQTSEHAISTQNPVGTADYIEDIDPTTAAKESLNSAYTLIQPTLNANTIDSISDDTEKDAIQAIEEQKYAYKAGLTIQISDTGNVSYFTYKREDDGTIRFKDNGEPRKRTLTPSSALIDAQTFTTTVDSSGDEIVTAGLYDKRIGSGLNIAELDMGALTTLIHDNDQDDWGGDNKHQPEKWWNGIVYIELPQQYSSSSRDDYVNPAITNWGVKVVNGQTIPNPEFLHSDDTYGTALATNSMMYIHGHYNSDGDMDTGSPTEADITRTTDSTGDSIGFASEGEEAPASLIADSLTFLSANWDDAKSNTGNTDQRVATSTEVSAAILTGLVPSGETGSDRYSGGVENFPRFLEKWSGKQLRLRGSIVALFESEVGTAPWGSGNVYNPPARNWGFHSDYAKGFLPPGTPNSRGFRGRDQEVITKDEYYARVEIIKQNFSSEEDE